ncbi:polysaccharide deacetylase family protein [Paractinoplanes lichenicola]|uniref:Polysaccharide deacetylase family protein n=1 Tax=Paractinoplanes lichenicola TaxID=2802976 RepID=A0ABS1VFM5_9ACTN|nr:polysaccharide deacetylase family protein [Actinoplanes lichenicola]MBL7253502.1 polysaccharide deacetylase family protein [Actinoplanes lichenicola]
MSIQQQRWTGSRRVLLTLGGLSLLSACAKPQPEPDAPELPPATVPPSSAPPSPSPSPTPTGLPRTPVQKEPRYVVPTGRGAKVVALTLDDGPHPAYTPQVLKLLRKHHVKATFFVIGQQAAAHPDLVRAIAADGHTIGTHTWSHVDLKKQSAGRVKTEVGRTVDTVAATTGRIPGLFRAPYGSWSPTVFQVCATLGQTSIAWDVDPRDWDNPGAGRIRSKILDQVGNRSIVLTHDGGGDRSQTVQALRGVVPVLLDSGYRFVGV